MCSSYFNHWFDQINPQLNVNDVMHVESYLRNLLYKKDSKFMILYRYASG